MIYCEEVLIPANTVKLIPLTTQLDVVEGIVTRVWVRWRWGSANLAGAAIFRGGFQVWPSTAGRWFPSTIFDTVFDEAYLIDDEPLHFILRTYNEDTRFPHRVWIACSVLRPQYTEGLIGLMDYLTGQGGA